MHGEDAIGAGGCCVGECHGAFASLKELDTIPGERKDGFTDGGVDGGEGVVVDMKDKSDGTITSVNIFSGLVIGAFIFVINTI